ncbi:MAG TPA: SRPBCC family protein [Terriglobia bacterium]|jgi:carbon monoxide dehydrogenase subunit G
MIKKTVEIDAPPGRVWPVLADVERWHEWTPSIRSIRRLEGGPFTVGSSACVSQPKLREAIWTVSHLEPGRGFTWTSGGSGLFRATGSHLIEPSGNGSRVTLSVEFKGLLGGLAGLAFGKLTDEYLAMEAAGLKRKCEL